MSEYPDGSGQQRLRERLIRWQGITIQQLGYVNNLLTGLTGGMVALLMQTIIGGGKGFQPAQRFMALFSMSFLSVSLLVGISAAWIRLFDFRMTTQKVRLRREATQREHLKSIGKEIKCLDKTVWVMLTIQMVLFVLGSIALLALATSYLGQSPPDLSLPL